MICSIKRLRAEINGNALFDISGIEVPGECCTIYGPSGIGKSTFLKGLANGLDETRVAGVVFRKLIDFNPAINNIRYIPQNPPRFDFSVDTFFRRMQAANENLPGCAKILARVCEAFNLGEILANSMMSISGGQLHRVHLAAGLASRGDLLLLDEPTAALDDANAMILMGLLTEFIRDRNGFVLCCTHDQKFRLQCDIEKSWRAVEFPSFSETRDPKDEKTISS